MTNACRPTMSNVAEQNDTCYFSHICSNSSELKLSHLNVLARLTVHYYRITFYVCLHRKLTKVNKKPRLNVLSMKGVERISFYLVTNSKDYTGRSS